MFKKHFDTAVCEGEHIECMVGPYLCRAVVDRDPDSGRPEEHDEHFWPTRSDCKSDAAFERATGRAKIVLDRWDNDEWFYAGVGVRVTLAGVWDPASLWRAPDDSVPNVRDELVLVSERETTIWGVEANYPQFDKRRRSNKYLRDVANEQLPEALELAKKALAEHMADKIRGTGAYKRRRVA